MGLVEGYHVGKDFAQSLADKDYERELSGIKTPDQMAAERAAKGVQDQGAADFAKNATAPRKLANPMASPAEPQGGQQSPAIGVSQVSDQPTLNDQMDYIRQRAAVDIKHGKMDTDGVIKLSGVLKSMQQEGLLQSIAKMNAGDIAGGVDMYNGAGKHRVKLVSSQDSQYDAGGVKIPTKLITIQDANGNQETINTASFLDSALGIQHIVEQSQKGKELSIKADKNAEDARHNAASEGIDRIKANAEKTKAEKPGYKIEGSEVANALGDPATDAKGKPIVDPFSGRQIVNRNQAKESKFYQWMRDNNITDTNEGLARYLGNAQANPAAPAAKIPTKPLSAY